VRELLDAARRLMACPHAIAKTVTVTESDPELRARFEYCYDCGSYRRGGEWIRPNFFDPLRGEADGDEADIIERTRRRTPQAFAGQPANDDDPAGARYALERAGAQLREILALHEGIYGFDRTVRGYAEAHAAIVRRLEVAFAEYAKAEQRLRAVQEGGVS